MSAKRAAIAAAAALGCLTGVRAAAAGAAAHAAQPPLVQSMIVGSSGELIAPARTVSAPAVTLRVGRRRCAVAAGTPLAALVAAVRGGPRFALRDYGRCGAAPRDSAELFVTAIGGERNRGQNGWVYKIGNVAGTTGAADASGAFGNGRRLRSGERVLWFWCRAFAGGCQRTLAEAPVPATITAGTALTVAVFGYDDQGRGVPIAGCAVTLGSAAAATASSGRATLIVPSTPGRYQLNASRRGLVPAFPQTITVR